MCNGVAAGSLMNNQHATTATVPRLSIVVWHVNHCLHMYDKPRTQIRQRRVIQEQANIEEALEKGVLSSPPGDKAED